MMSRFWSIVIYNNYNYSDYQKLIDLKGNDADTQYHWGKFYDGVYASQTVK